MAFPTREQFIETILEVVPKKFPLVKLARGDEPFSMRVNGHAVALENLYRLVMLRPEEARVQIERWVVELLRAAEHGHDRARSFKALKDRIFPMVLSDEASRTVHSQTFTEPLVMGLRVAYAVDDDRSMAYVPRQQFEAWKIAPEKLRQVAIENLIGRSESMSANAAQDEYGRVNLILFQTGDGYDASRILLPGLHDRLREFLGSPFVGAIPNRDILLCFRDEEQTVRRVKSQVEEDYLRMPHQVSRDLFLITADGIAPRKS